MFPEKYKVFINNINDGIGRNLFDSMKQLDTFIALGGLENLREISKYLDREESMQILTLIRLFIDSYESENFELCSSYFNTMFRNLREKVKINH